VEVGVRKLAKMNVINAITRIGREAVSEKKDAQRQNGGLFSSSTEFIIPDGTKGWDSLPEVWKKIAMKSLKIHIKKRASQHVRSFQVKEMNLHNVVNEAAEHMKEIFGHMLFTTATSAAGQSASQHNINALCEAILSSLAMERELHPLLTMFLTYAAESPYVADRRDDPFAISDRNKEMAEELAEVEAMEKRFSSQAKSRAESAAAERASQKSVGSNFDFSKTASTDNIQAKSRAAEAGMDAKKKPKMKLTLNRERKGTGYAEPTVNAAHSTRKKYVAPPKVEEPKFDTSVDPIHEPPTVSTGRTYSEADNKLYEGMGGLD